MEYKYKSAVIIRKENRYCCTLFALMYRVYDVAEGEQFVSRVGGVSHYLPCRLSVLEVCSTMLYCYFYSNVRSMYKCSWRVNVKNCHNSL